MQSKFLSLKTNESVLVKSEHVTRRMRSLSGNLPLAAMENLM